MRSFALFGLAAVVAASSSLEHKVEEIHVPAVKEAAPVITVIGANKTYAVKYGCAGCPFGVLKTPHAAEWIHPPPQNSLMLTLAIDKSGSALLLNDERIFPLDPLPPRISAVQVPMDLAEDEADAQAEEVMSKRIRFPLQYEHTVFRTEGNGEVWLQFNVTGLAWGEEATPFKLGHTVLQVLLREQHVRPESPGQKGCSHALSIASVQVVEEKDRVQPPRLKCGRLAMIRTAFDPNEWDDYGKFGTWARTWNLAIGKLGALWPGSSQSNMLLPLSLLLAASFLVARCIWQFRQQIQIGGDSAAGSWLLGCHAPPAYADIPVIKIEQYD